MDHRGFHSFGIETDGGSAMDVDHQQEEEEEEEEEEDHFLKFVDYARTELLPEDEDNYGKNVNGFDTTAPGWSWIVSRILKTCMAYSSGVTSAILLSDLSQAWHEQLRVGAPKKRLELTNLLRKNNRRRKLHNTVTIDSIYQKNFMSLNSSLEVVIVDAFVLPGTNIYMLTLGDYWSSNIIDLYLHRRYYDLAEPQNGILKKGREIFLTGCYLRTAAAAGSGYPRLLPTEYLVILLDEDQDDDAMLLGAQFCSDSFSSISVDSVDKGASYSLYARIENIGSLEKFGSLQRKQITLVDNDGVKLKFLLWGEQILLANLFSVGSMLALERPYIASSVESKIEASEELCLEFGSATQLYLVPYIQHEEHVCVALTQNRHQSSRLLSAFDPSQGPKVSQVSLHRDSQGTIDYSNYPFQSFVVDLHDKMTGISLYGVVTDIIKEKDTGGLIFSLRIEDTSGVIWAKLHLASSWSLGRLSLGHTVFISGLTCSMTKHKRLEVSWFENGVGASLINISCLPALLNSHCLHKFSRLSDISIQASYTQICGVRLDPIEHYHVNTGFSHSLCGHFVNMTTSGFAECSFCHINCDTEVVCTFHLKITLTDESAKVLAWCTGQTAMELLQISPEEFSELPEEEQVMYPSSLANEKFVVALVNCKREGPSLNLLDADAVSLEITRAYRCE
ncbi:Nucleic acid-binding-like protein [Quillaja saponaria]|uniref:Nucleic acid-binding-like protein n=1 Tax=Quillaja saponaria TaxID=32244 RepID=A0AAD7PHL2_QUISA|nr:Nucleic acid-binding-like protein [Quillaja saponaria]